MASTAGNQCKQWSFLAVATEANVCTGPRRIVDVLENSHVRLAIHEAARCAFFDTIVGAVWILRYERLCLWYLLAERVGVKRHV